MHLSIVEAPINGICVKTIQMSRLMEYVDSLLITIYQEVNDLLRSNTCCDDENERTGGNTGLPEQHFFEFKMKIHSLTNTYDISIS
jgi:hypothetical protein